MSVVAQADDECTSPVDQTPESTRNHKSCKAEVGTDVWAPTTEIGPQRKETLRTLIARGVAASEDHSPFAFAAGALLQLSEDLYVLTEAYCCGNDDVPDRLQTAIWRLSERASAASELSYRFCDAERLNGGK